MILHVIGAGVAGLACAVRAANAGIDVVLHEATDHAGGRTRSFYDESLGGIIDNGNHLLLSANHATLNYLATIGSKDYLVSIEPAAFPFVDLISGDSWCLRPGSGSLPLWLFSPARRVKGCSSMEHVCGILRLMRAGERDTVAAALGNRSRLSERLWHPLTFAVLNTIPGEAAASLLRTTVAKTIVRGEKSCRPLFFARGLSDTLVSPALEFLRERNANVKFNNRVTEIGHDGGAATALSLLGKGDLRLGPHDAAVLAVPPPECDRLWRGSASPMEFSAIVNVHFRLEYPPAMPWNIPFLGLIGSTTHWLFLRGDILSATISAAGAIADESRTAIATCVWNEVSRAVSIPLHPVPPFRVIKERRATMAQTPAQIAQRPGTKTALKNLFLAGDWTDTGLPATIEGAVQSGFRAADLAIASFRSG